MPTSRDSFTGHDQLDRMTHFPVVLLAGPTGVGKTSLAIRLAKHLGAEIINADSMQVYRFMDIGTAKPTPEERIEVAHHLLDVVTPNEPFDAARYMEMARPVIDTLHTSGRLPLVVGGTGLYMKILIKGICSGAPSSEIVRRGLLEQMQCLGLKALHDELKGVDPILGERIHPNDRQRILRGLEVFRLTGKPLSQWQRHHRFAEDRYTAVKIALGRERTELYGRIEQRVFHMMEQGFVAEVEGLLEMGFGPDLKPMQSLGYRQVVRHLAGEYPIEAAVREIQKDTRHYARRQMTWFRNDREYHWFHPDERERIIEWIDDQLERYAKPSSIS